VSLGFDVQLKRNRHVPGDTVRGTVTVTKGGKSRSLEVFLLYREHTDDYNETAIELGSGPLHQGELQTGASYSFELQLPEDALPAHESKHGKLYWEVDVKSDERGRDSHERVRLDVEAGKAGVLGES